MTAPEEVSIDSVIASVISELERISSLKEEQRTTLKAFNGGKRCFRSSSGWFQLPFGELM